MNTSEQTKGSPYKEFVRLLYIYKIRTVPGNDQSEERFYFRLL